MDTRKTTKINQAPSKISTHAPSGKDAKHFRKAMQGQESFHVDDGKGCCVVEDEDIPGMDVADVIVLGGGKTQQGKRPHHHMLFGGGKDDSQSQEGGPFPKGIGVSSGLGLSDEEWQEVVDEFGPDVARALGMMVGGSKSGGPKGSKVSKGSDKDPSLGKHVDGEEEGGEAIDPQVTASGQHHPKASGHQPPGGHFPSGGRSGEEVKKGQYQSGPGKEEEGTQVDPEPTQGKSHHEDGEGKHLPTGPHTGLSRVQKKQGMSRLSPAVVKPTQGSMSILVKGFADKLSHVSSHHWHKEKRGVGDGVGVSFPMLCTFPVCQPMIVMGNGDMVSADSLDFSDWDNASCLLGINGNDDLCGLSIPDGALQMVCSIVLGNNPKTDDHRDDLIVENPNPWGQQTDDMSLSAISKGDIDLLSKNILMRIEHVSEMRDHSSAQMQLHVSGLGTVHVMLVSQSESLKIMMTVMSPAVAAVLARAMPVLMVGMSKSSTMKKFQEIRFQLSVSSETE